ncbi:MAG: leucyl/phenylalanyl-tRNA--protein transferase [Chlorobiaceae bacterium]|nr:leucyl/phenylalanyl-tRNA--protein transferase [Chlorobiaceae bacterium]NTV59837.1 leucyl/phenylalanyl-tRNA--protein transferase [Chlorobiaceae bacterium]
MIRIDELLRAYRLGYFPMANPEDGKIYWCQPHKRAVFPLESYTASRQVKRVIRDRQYTVTIDKAFEKVVGECAAPRKNDSGTWISGEIAEAYILLNRMGVAHSFESWHDGELAGGLYGVSIGGAFFGESMFFRRSYASQVAFDRLVFHLRSRGYLLLDAQIMNPHLEKLGALEISHEEYMLQLHRAMKKKIVFLQAGEK